MTAENWRAPEVPANETIIFDEPGRVLNRVDFTSHHFRVTREGDSLFRLRVRHGAGDEVVPLGYGYRGVAAALAMLDSDSRYQMLYALHAVRREGRDEGRATTRGQYVRAFADGRLKKRKVRGRAEVKVWIEPAREPMAAPAQAKAA